MEYRQAICPVCGTSHGREVIRTVPGKQYIPLEHGNYWERTEHFKPDKPFGVIMASEGRGTLRAVGYFQPQDDPDGYFPLVKARVLATVKEWLANGWISQKEVKQLLH